MHTDWNTSQYYINPIEIKIIQFEPTSYCNLRCVGCSRTDKHTGLPTQLVLNHQQHISLDLIEPIFKDLTNLKRIKFDGDIGDCFSHPKLYEIVEKILEIHPQVSINLHTNLSNGSDETFKKLISLPNQVYIIAGVDGLYDECSTYRQGASWKVIQKRFEMIRDYSPNKHEWRWLDFDFNRHQLDEAKQMAKDYKFYHLELGTPYSNSNEQTNNKIKDFKENKITNKGIISDSKNKIKEYVQSRNKFINESFEDAMDRMPDFNHTVNKVKNTKTGRQHICPWQVNKSLQVMSNGAVWPCCWSSDMNKFLATFGTDKSLEPSLNLNSEFEMQYFLHDWLIKIGKDWKKEITITSKNTIADVMKSNVYKKLDRLLTPKQDNYILDKCTDSCSKFIEKNLIKAAEDGNIVSNINSTDNNEQSS